MRSILSQQLGLQVTKILRGRSKQTLNYIMSNEILLGVRRFRLAFFGKETGKSNNIYLPLKRISQCNKMFKAWSLKIWVKTKAFLPTKKIFERRTFSSVVEFFFPFPDFALDAQNRPQDRWRVAKCKMAPRLGGRQIVGSNAAAGHIQDIFRYSLTHSYFLIAKNWFFSTDFRVSRKVGFFENLSVLLRKTNKMIILSFFSKKFGIKPDFLQKPKK